MSLSFEPVRRGKIYCSPACGAACTWRDYQTAIRKALALAARCGRGWKIRVNENCGWHYGATSPGGHIHVYQGAAVFHALLHPEKDTCAGRWTATAKTPKGAIRRVLQAATAEYDLIGLMLKAP